MKTFTHYFSLGILSLSMLFAASETAAQGVEISSATSGDWHDPETWDCNCIPTEEDNVTITTGLEINLAENSTVHNLTIDSAGVLQSNPSLAVELSLLGNWHNEGEFHSETGKITLSGTDQQTLSGIITFYDLEISNDRDVELNGECNIIHSLSINQANLITNGNLYLRSTNGTTASVLPLTDGEITGMVHFEKSVQSTVSGWHQFGVPFSDATIEQLNDDLPTTGYPGSSYPNVDWVSVRSYNEEADDQTSTSYYYVQDASELITSGKGYYLYSNAGSYMLDFEGTLNTGEVTFPVTFTDYDNTKLDGLNFLSNPYPSAIDVRNEGGWNATNLSNAIYGWDSEEKRFRTYMNGYSINQGSPIIEIGDPIWVQATDASASLTLNEQVKTTETIAEVNTANDFLRMKLTNGNTQDEFIVVFDENASENYESDKDAFKYESIANMINVSTRNVEDFTMSINSIPTPPEAIALPIVMRLNAAGDYSLETQNFPEVIDLDRCFGIEDLVTGEYYPLTDSTSIDFSVAQAVTNEVRFVIHLGDQLVSEVTDIGCHGMSDGEIHVSGQGAGPFDYYLFDSNMNQISSETGVDGPYTFSGLYNGEYIVEVHNNEFCSVKSATAEVTQASQLTASAALEHVGCAEDSTGTINLFPTGGTPPFSFSWSNGQVSEDLENLPGGAYTVTVIDSNGCTRTVTHNIFEPEDVIAQFTSDTQLVELSDGEAEVQFINETEGATMFEWNFDDGSPVSTDENPLHIFTQAGTFTVMLTAMNENCLDTFETEINVQPETNVEEIGDGNLVKIAKNQSGWYLDLEFTQTHQLEVNVYNLLGQKIIEPIRGQFVNQQLNLGQLSESTVKLIEVRDIATGETSTFKVMH